MKKDILILKWAHIEKWAGLLILCVRTFLHYCNTNNTSTILVMEGIRAGWNKALWTIYYFCWNETQPRNRIMLLAGPWWWNWHFWGDESGPLLRQSGQHRFPSCSYNTRRRKSSLSRILAKTNWAVGIKTEILYCCRSGREGQDR